LTSLSTGFHFVVFTATGGAPATTARSFSKQTALRRANNRLLLLLTTTPLAVAFALATPRCGFGFAFARATMRASQLKEQAAGTQVK
jgi:hypothetical protein